MSTNGNLTDKQRAVLTVFADGGPRSEFNVHATFSRRAVGWPERRLPWEFHPYLRKLTERGYLSRGETGRHGRLEWTITDEGRKALAA